MLHKYMMYSNRAGTEEKGDTMADSSIRTFGGLLQSLEDGQLLVDLGEKLTELNAKISRQAEATGKAKGEIRLIVKLAADDSGIVQIDTDIVCKEPKSPRRKTVMWIGKDNALCGENPKQTKLPLREVAAPKAAGSGSRRVTAVFPNDVPVDEDGVIAE